MFVDKAFWVAKNTHKDYLQKMSEDPLRHIKLTPLHAIFPEIEVKDPAVDLFFIFENDENFASVIAKLYDYRDRYQSLMDMIQKRNDLHLRLQEIVAEMRRKSGSEYVSDADLKEGLGIAIWGNLKTMTDSIYGDTDYIINHHGELKNQLIKIFREFFPKNKILELVPA